MNAPLAPDLIARAIRLRHEIHRRPELGFEEHATAALICGELQAAGLVITAGIGGTGVVGTLQRGTGRRALMIRADIDALPLTEATGLPHASGEAGKMHACGHDGHVAIALAAMWHCAAMPDLDGTVHFAFQPAEEGLGGAKSMIDDGLFRRFPCETVHALHNWPALPFGTCAALPGAMMGAMAFFEIEIVGQGCHAAMPHEGRSALAAGSALVGYLDAIVSRTIPADRAAVLSVTQIHAGNGWNSIPDQCTLRGTARWLDDGDGALLESELKRASDAVATAFGCVATIAFEPRYPILRNDPDAVAETLDAVRSVGGSIAAVAPSLGSEDFAFMLAERPGCYLWLGADDGSGGPGLHSPRYDFNDALIPLGARLWSALVRRKLAPSPSPTFGA